MHLVGRFIHHSYRFLDLLIWWIATWNGWNMRQPVWRCDIIAKLSKLDAPSKRATFDDANNKEYCVVIVEDVDENLENDANWRRTTWDIYWIWKCYWLLKALKLYTTLSTISTTNCFAPMFKRKLDKCLMNCNDRLRRFSETLTNWHWMSSVKIHAFATNNFAWHVQTLMYEP